MIKNLKMYWFATNLMAYVLFLIFLIPYTIHITIWTIMKTTKILFVNDGAQKIILPWKWVWWSDD